MKRMSRVTIVGVWLWVMWAACFARISDASASNPWKAGVAAFEAYQFQKAIPLFNQVLVAPPASWKRRQKAKAFLYLSLCHYNLGRVTRAKQIYQRTHAIDPKVPLPANMPGNVRTSYTRWRLELTAQKPRPTPPRQPPGARKSDVPPTKKPDTRAAQKPDIRAAVSKRETPRDRPTPRIVARRALTPAPRPKPGFRHVGSVVILGLAVAVGGGALAATLVSQQANQRKEKLEIQGKSANANELTAAYEEANNSALAGVVLWSVAGGAALTGLVVLVYELASTPRASQRIPPAKPADQARAMSLEAWSL